MDEDELELLSLYETEFSNARAALEALERSVVEMTETTLPCKDLLASRVGGPLVWPANTASPVDQSKGELVFAFQINLKEVSGLGDFPSSGILQVFLSDSLLSRGICASPDYWKPGYYPLRNGDGFQLVYHPVGPKWLIPGIKHGLWEGVRF